MKNNTNEETLFDHKYGNKEETLKDNVKTAKSDETLKDDKSVVSNDKVSEPENTNKSQSRWGKVASGFGMGILLGTTSSFVSAKAAYDIINGNGGEDEIGSNNDSGNGTNTDTGQETSAAAGTDTDSTNVWSDGALPVAESVSDEMTFTEAFGAARAELGAGGVFEWRGNVYNTYYAEEWDKMSDAEKDEFVDHLSLTDIEDDTMSDDVVEVVALDDVIDENNDDIVLVSIDEPDDVMDVVPEETEPEIEILGVYHDDDLDMNVGGAVIEGQPVVFLDADADNVNFEFMATDLNNDGQIGTDEIFDISEYDMPVDSLRTDIIDNSYLASNDLPDYISDADVSDMM